MLENGTAYEDALRDAQKKGYAEANPAADVEGLDAARKIVILAALSFGTLLSPDKIHCEGITKITAEDAEIAKAFGCSVKLIGHTEKIDGKVYAGVSPYLVPAANPVSHVDDVFNGILVDANMLGRALFYGAGAGKLPTASAVVADIIDVLSNRANERKLPDWRVAQPAEIADADAYACRRCFLIEGCPKCAEKAKAAFGVDQVAMLDSKFAIISKPTTKKAAEAILTAAGLTPVWSLPVLD
jgi:homoserine dehydrogenase